MNDHGRLRLSLLVPERPLSPRDAGRWAFGNRRAAGRLIVKQASAGVSNALHLAATDMKVASERFAIRSRLRAAAVDERESATAWDPMFCLAVGSAFAGFFVIAILAGRGIAALAELDHTTGLLVDFEVYWSQARELIGGGERLSDRWLYPAFAALVLLPFGTLKLGTAKALLWCVQGALTLSLVRLCYARLSGLPPLVRWLSGSGLVLHSLPVLHCLKWGQLSLLVVTLALVALPKSRWTSAFMLATAANLKAYPSVYAALYVARCDARAFLRFVIAALLIGVAAPLAMLGPHVCEAMWFRCLAGVVGLGRFTGVDSQSLSALVHKLWWGADGWECTVAALALSGVFVGLTWMRVRRGREEPVTNEDVVAIVLCAALVCNPAWVHYFVVLPVAQATLIGRSRQDRAAAWLCALSILISAAATILATVSRTGFVSVERYGLVTVAASACLIGIWCIKPESHHREPAL